MSQQNIDENVVKMSFDNAEFEKGVQTSMSTLDKLKNSLNMSSSIKSLNELDKAANSISFTGLSSGLDSVKMKFSALEVAGMTVISNLTTTAMNALSNVYNTTLGQIKSGGWRRALNIEHANFMLQGLTNNLKNADEVVAQVMEDANYAVTDTAYGLDAAANAAAQFYASGVKEGDDMKQALLAISGVAAMTSSEYEDISRIFTTVAGNGRLMADQLLQFSARGLNAAAALATYLGTSETEIRDMVSKGKIDFQTFAKAMSDTFGAQAKKANDTFTGALSNMKAALSRVGALFAQPALTQFRDMLNSLTPVINTVKNALAPFVEVYEKTLTTISKKTQSALSTFQELLNYKNSIGLSKWNELKGIYGEDTMSALRKALMKNIKENDEATYKLIKQAGSFKDSLAEGWLSPDLINSALSDALDETASAADKTTASMKILNKVATEVIRGNYGNGYARVKALTKAGYDYASVQSIVNNRILGTKVNIKNLSDAQLKSVGYSKEQIKALRTLSEEAENANTPLNELMSSLEYKSTSELVIESLLNTFKALKRVLSALKGGFDEVFPAKSQKQIHSVVRALTKFTKSLIPTKKQTKKLTSVFKGLFSILDLIAYYVTGALKIGFETLCNIFGIFSDDALNTSSSLGDLIFRFRNWAKENDKILPTLEKVAEALTNGLSAIKEWISQFKETDAIQNGLDTIKFKAGEMYSFISSKALNGISALRMFISSLNLSNVLSPENVVSGLISIKNTALNVKDSFVEFIQSLMNMDSISLDSIRECLSDLWESLKNIFGFSDTEVDVISDSITTIEEFDSALAGFNSTAEESNNKVVGFFNNLKNVLSKVDWGSVAAVASMIGIIVGAEKLAKRVNDSVGISGLISSLTGVFRAIASDLKIYQKEINSKAVLNIAKAVEALAIALGIIALIPSNKLASCGVALAALASGLVVLTWAFNKILSGENLASSTKNVLGLSSVLSALAGLAGTLLSVSIALAILSSIKTDGLQEKIVAIGEILATFIGTFLSIGVINSVIGAVTAAPILAMSASLLLIVLAIEHVCNNITLTDETILSLMVVFGGIVTLFKFLSVNSSGIGNNVGKVGLMALGIAAAMTSFAVAIAIIGRMDLAVIGKGSLVISGLMVFIGLMLKLESSGMGDSSGAKGAAVLAGVAVVLVAITGIIAVLGHMKTETLLKGGAAVVAAMTMLLLILRMSQNISKNFNKGSLVGLGVSITLIAASMAALTFIDPSKLKTAAVCLSGIMAMFALILKVSGSMATVKAGLIIMTGCVVLLAGVLYLLSTIPDPNAVLTVAKALSGLMLALSITLQLISSIRTVATNGFIGLGILSGVALLLGSFLAILSGQIKDPDKYLKVTAAISAVMLSLSASLLLISVAALVAETAMLGFVTLGAALGAILVVCGVLGYFEQLRTPVIAGIEVLETLGTGLGTALGNFVSAFSETVTASLAKCGTNLSDFITNLQPFIDSISNLPDNLLANVGQLCSVITKLGSSELISSWESFLNIPGAIHEVFTGESTEESMVKKLTSFIEPLAQLSNDLSAINNWGALTSFGTVIQKLLDAMSSLSNSNLNTPNNMNKFGEALASFGNNLKIFYSSIENISPSLIGTFATNLNSLIDTLSRSGEVDNSSVNNLGTSISNLAGSSGLQDLLGGSNFKEWSAVAKDQGSTYVSSLVDGATDSNAQKLLSSAGTDITDYVDDSVDLESLGVDIGENLDEGLAKGMLGKLNLVSSAANTVGNTAADATRKATEVRSPSRVFKRIGAFCVEGFALGLQQYNAKDLVGASTMAETINKMSDIIDGSMDITPTISPVVDLSSVRSASNSINGLLGSSSARLAVSTSGISSGVSSIQNGRNSDVISALNKLAQKFDKTIGDSYTINGITYDDGSNVASAVQSLVRAARVERRM